ncbi:hypothetical protein NL108_004184 [Boleophthalmus pectinirostris]|nr:hypothetical protein NL108_004184 [Boleophthalmus pectinirostris]
MSSTFLPLPCALPPTQLRSSGSAEAFPTGLTSGGPGPTTAHYKGRVCAASFTDSHGILRRHEGSLTMKMSAAEILKEGELEKRSDNLLQFWKRKTCVLTADSLNIYPDTQKRSKAKELKLQSIKKVDCVERTGKFVYFTIVTTDNKEIDFRCSGEENCWNAVITMALIDYQNRKAIQDFKTRQDNESASPGQHERRMARAP